jgi:hypothetical protein
MVKQVFENNIGIPLFYQNGLFIFCGNWLEYFERNEENEFVMKYKNAKEIKSYGGFRCLCILNSNLVLRIGENLVFY